MAQRSTVPVFTALAYCESVPPIFVCQVTGGCAKDAIAIAQLTGVNIFS